MTNKTTILHIIDYLGRGGAEVMLVSVLKELSEFHNIVVTLNAENHFGDEFKCDEYYCLEMGAFYNFPLASLKLAKLIKSKKVDIVHSHLFSSTLVARFSVPKRIPLVTTIHTHVNTRDYRKLYIKLLEKISYKKHRSTIVGVSQPVLHNYFKHHKHNPYRKYLLHTFANEVASTSVKRYQPENEPACFRAVAIGALRYPKNHMFLIKAFRELKDSNIELDIYGTGILHDELLSVIQETGVKVTLMGEVKNAAQLLPQYDLFIMPSEFEGFSLSVLEAMSTPVPMLLSDIPSFRDQCGDTAIFFSLEYIEDFVEKIKFLACNRELGEQLARKAREKFQNNYTIEHHMAGLRTIYQETLLNQ